MGGVTVTAPPLETLLPELPEVEITRRHLEEAMRGRRIVQARVTHQRTARHNASAAEIEQRLQGRKVHSVGRRGKFLVVELDDGDAMIAHLGMSGRFSVTSPDEERAAHTHFVALLDDGREVRFVDPRTFGFIAVVDQDDMARSGVGRLGPDAWEDPPAVADLVDLLAGRTAPIKALLLDQRLMAGLGNIYADEALHRAGVHPLSPGGELNETRIGALLEATRHVLTGAIERGGTTLDDLAYLLPDGRAGDNLDRLKVYGRDGEPCFECGSPIERVVVRGRSTHFCPECQTRPL